MLTHALRSLWKEPPASDPPARGRRDWALVAAVMVSSLLEGTLGPGISWRPVVTIVALTLAPVLLWRRTHPLVTVIVGFGVGTALGLVGSFAGESGVGLATMVFVLVLAHSLTRWGSGRQIVIGLVVAVLAAAVSILTDYTGLAEAFGGLGILAAAVASGAALRLRAESERRAREQIRNQERVDLARELHDSVAHHVSAITLQAQAGRAVASQRPEAALEALAVVEAEATRTLAEMRAMVRVLRDGQPAEYAPQPRSADLAALARREPSPVIDVEVAGDLSDLRPQVDAAIYRIAQESVTNALRHARGATRVQVSVTQSASAVRLRVSDDGHPEPARATTHGFGLVGMSERAQLLGGTLHAGPAPDGGWIVDAELPKELSR
ncbi:signal transduction histidine kinase [Kineosphaera limosa]|uniref:histidine kinase n=1 Tax=Kineosphaera limosa NBRC 100340 TaxID=1184609 RepID=K6WQQ5_9MICO|nr:sensor histidine kinase [Kineosphaera limosa]NYE03100.1 signal transduction histidine kinase [Kineosphaera limosa]GAB94437.1 putative two-component histidine kinase [Kineosphaera limosa NBRC 100340]